MASPTTKLTYHDYLQLPEDGKRYEIMDGDLYMTPAPATRHQQIVVRLTQILAAYLEAHPIGALYVAPTDVLLSDNDIVQPDLLIVLDRGTARITEKNIQGPPDIVIEVLSPSTVARDLDLKRKRYEHFGVREYWMVDPDQNTLEMLQLTQEGRLQRLSHTARPEHCTSALLPGLIFDLAWLLK
jgi:Uma2 family endonuclease